jgi:hypothetical protein
MEDCSYVKSIVDVRDNYGDAQNRGKPLKLMEKQIKDPRGQAANCLQTIPCLDYVLTHDTCIL